MDIIASLLLNSVTRSILFMLSKVISPLKRKILEKIKNEIEIRNKGELNFITNLSYPAAWLKFEIISKTEINLTTKQIIAWVIFGGAAIDKINWSWQEKILEKGKESAVYTGSTTFHNIINVPSKENVYFSFYYPLPLNVDFGKNRLGLEGVIEFDSSFGTILKDFEVHFELSKDKWEEALNIWRESYKNEKTILNLR
ncbi:MAG: hypothetical protein KKG76_12080 [Euryarchaeota archaeon]|nr:hypothetical protein [Euryarchaeota archaeon]MBU4139898.1 hypothetical protein [Euryarchaeota archaeon]